MMCAVCCQHCLLSVAQHANAEKQVPPADRSKIACEPCEAAALKRWVCSEGVWRQLPQQGADGGLQAPHGGSQAAGPSQCGRATAAVLLRPPLPWLLLLPAQWRTHLQSTHSGAFKPPINIKIQRPLLALRACCLSSYSGHMPIRPDWMLGGPYLYICIVTAAD